MKVSFLAATSIALAALVSSCGSSSPQSSSALQASSNSSMSRWVDVTTTDGTTPSTCAKTPANCSMQDPVSGLRWRKRLPSLEFWRGALDACAALTHNGKKAGTWRLPTKDELEAAYVNGIHDAGIHQSNWYWSADSYNTDQAWIVYLGDGKPYLVNKGSYNAVVCVQ